MADFEDASVAEFQHVYLNASIAGCWFHYAQVIIKRTNKIGLKDAYGSDDPPNICMHRIFPETTVIGLHFRR